MISFLETMYMGVSTSKYGYQQIVICNGTEKTIGTYGCKHSFTSDLIDLIIKHSDNFTLQVGKLKSDDPTIMKVSFFPTFEIQGETLTELLRLLRNELENGYLAKVFKPIIPGSEIKKEIDAIAQAQNIIDKDYHMYTSLKMILDERYQHLFNLSNLQDHEYLFVLKHNQTVFFNRSRRTYTNTIGFILTKRCVSDVIEGIHSHLKTDFSSDDYDPNERFEKIEHDVYRIIYDLYRQLQAIHRSKYVHGDIKIENVVVCDHRAHFIDFGSLRPANVYAHESTYVPYYYVKSDIGSSTGTLSHYPYQIAHNSITYNIYWPSIPNGETIAALSLKLSTQFKKIPDVAEKNYLVDLYAFALLVCEIVMKTLGKLKKDYLAKSFFTNAEKVINKTMTIEQFIAEMKIVEKRARYPMFDNFFGALIFTCLYPDFMRSSS